MDIQRYFHSNTCFFLRGIKSYDEVNTIEYNSNLSQYEYEYL